MPLCFPSGFSGRGRRADEGACWRRLTRQVLSEAVLPTGEPGGWRAGRAGFAELETESLMHLAHAFAPGLRGWYAEACGLDPGWTVPAGPGGPDPYLVPRGGTKMKKSNKRIH